MNMHYRYLRRCPIESPLYQLPRLFPVEPLLPPPVVPLRSSQTRRLRSSDPVAGSERSVYLRQAVGVGPHSTSTGHLPPSHCNARSGRCSSQTHFERPVSAQNDTLLRGERAYEPSRWRAAYLHRSAVSMSVFCRCSDSLRLLSRHCI